MAGTNEKSGCLGGLAGLIFLASLPAFPIFLIILLVNLHTNGASSYHPSFDYNASSISLIGEPGKTVAFDLTGQTIDSAGYFGYSGPLWASDAGLNLELSDHSGFDQTFNLIGNVPENWGDSISCSGSCTGDFTITVNFALPFSLVEPAGRTLTGSLTGDIITPQTPSDSCNGTDNSGCGQFQDNTKQLNIPVSLKLGIIPINRNGPAIQISLIGTLASFGVIVAYLAAQPIIKKRKSSARKPRTKKERQPRKKAGAPAKRAPVNPPVPATSGQVPNPVNLLSCAFCGKNQKQVKKLIAGTGASICNECVSLVHSVIAGRGDGRAGTPIGVIQQVSDGAGPEKCAFCERRRNQVVAMASAGNNGIICNECLGLCDEILSEELPETSSQGIAKASSPQPAHTATTPAGFQTFINPNKSFSIAYPGDWQQAAASPGTGSLFTSQDRQREFQITGMNLGTSQADPAAAVSAACSQVGGMPGSPQTASIGGQRWMRAECDHSDGINHVVAQAVYSKGELFFMIYTSPKASFDSDAKQFFVPMEHSFQFL